MENNLELNSDEISNFLDNFELTKENIIDVIEYVHYKAILESFTYVIESSKKSSDTGLFAMEYIEISQKLEEILKKLKNNKKKMENFNPYIKENIEQTKEQLLDTTVDIFSWNVDYYLTEPDMEMMEELSIESRCTKIVDKIKLRVLIPDGYNQMNPKDISIINIPKKEFPQNKKPHMDDLVFFLEFKRFYYVNNVKSMDGFYEVGLEKYEIKRSL